MSRGCCFCGKNHCFPKKTYVHSPNHNKTTHKKSWLTPGTFQRPPLCGPATAWYHMRLQASRNSLLRAGRVNSWLWAAPQVPSLRRRKSHVTYQFPFVAACCTMQTKHHLGHSRSLCIIESRHQHHACVCVYVCMYVYACMHVCMHYIYIYIHMYVYTCTHTCTCIYVYIHIYIYIQYIHVHTCIYMYGRMYMYAHTYTYTSTYTYTYMYTYTYTY